jgi:hypothetical protein
MIDPKKQYKTRDGRAVRILVTDRKTLDTRNYGPVCALVTDADGSEHLRSYAEDGISAGSSEYDLLEVKPVREGWINLYPQPSKEYISPAVAYTGTSVFSTREEADRRGNRYNHPQGNRLACIKIQFTEGEGL